jgi:hypothetical protein
MLDMTDISIMDMHGKEPTDRARKSAIRRAGAAAALSPDPPGVSFDASAVDKERR